MPLSDIVSVSITAAANSPSRLGFGVPLIAAYHTHYSDLVREYSDLTSVAGDGFATTEGAYLAAQAVFSASPRPPTLKIGRRALVYTQVTKLTCLDATTGDIYNFRVGGMPITYTVPGSSTTTTVATAIAALITTAAPAGLATAAGSGAVITLTSTAGALVDVKTDAVHLTLKDNTSDPGIATDLNAILAADSNWYGLLLDSQGDAEVAAAAAWAESAPNKQFVFNSSDSDISASGSGDLFSTLKTSAYKKTVGLYAQTQLLCYSAAAWVGVIYPDDPGSENWAFKTLSGVPADNLTTNQIHNVEGKNGSVYTPVAGINITQFGKVPSGEFADIPRFIDWLTVELQTNIFGVLANAKKVPYTDPGVAVIQSTIAGVLEEGVDVGGLAALPKYVITVPKVASIGATDKGNRNIPNVSFTATLAGAINSVVIQGTVSL